MQKQYFWIKLLSLKIIFTICMLMERNLYLVGENCFSAMIHKKQTHKKNSLVTQWIRKQNQNQNQKLKKSYFLIKHFQMHRRHLLFNLIHVFVSFIQLYHKHRPYHCRPQSFTVLESLNSIIFQVIRIRIYILPTIS